ncbi:MAG: hypothetical protein V7742_12830 [Halioglobus sp.]
MFKSLHAVSLLCGESPFSPTIRQLRSQRLSPGRVCRLCLILGLVIVDLSIPAHAAIRLQVVVPVQPSPLFYVSVTSHHTALHLGKAHNQFRGLLKANKPHHISTGFSLTTTHFSAWAFHPDYLMVDVRTEGRMSALPKLEPQSWIEATANIDKLPMDGESPSFGHAVQNIEHYRKLYIPALDDTELAVPEGTLKKMTVFYENARNLAGIDGTPADDLSSTAARLVKWGEKALHDLTVTLSLTRAQRVAIENFRELSGGPRPMVRTLQNEPGFALVPKYLAKVKAGATDLDPPSWRGKKVEVHFTYARSDAYYLRTKEFPDTLPCYRGHTQFDARHIAGDIYSDLVETIETNFCLHPDGKWQFHNRWSQN